MKALANRKGLELGINTIVIIAIALMVLLVIAGFFFGGFGKIGGAIGGVGEGAEEEAEETDVGGEIGGIRDIWETKTGTCSGDFDCDYIYDEDVCNSLVAFQKCDEWYENAGRCNNGWNVDCAGLPEETCTAVGCTWTLDE